MFLQIICYSYIYIYKCNFIFFKSDYQGVFCFLLKKVMTQNLKMSQEEKGMKQTLYVRHD